MAIMAALICLFAGCKNNGKTLLPNVSGKVGEVVIVMDKDNWEGDLGTEVRDLLGSDCPWLAQKEPMYNLINVSPSGFADLFKVHRNIVIFNNDATPENEGIIYRSDVWAHPQCVIQITAGV